MFNNYVFAQHTTHEQPSLIDGFGIYDPRALALFEVGTFQAFSFIMNLLSTAL